MTGLPETEEQFQTWVIALAHLHGWLVHAERPAKTGKGWRTPIQGDAGFPDLVLAKAGRVIFAELKSAEGKMRADQDNWFAALWGSSLPGMPGEHQHKATIWRPSDRKLIERILGR